jgi:hypothetical protein
VGGNRRVVASHEGLNSCSHCINKKRSAVDDAEERDYKHMLVSSLRRKLDERGLDMDGSKEILIRRLEEGDKGLEVDGSKEMLISYLE